MDYNPIHILRVIYLGQKCSMASWLRLADRYFRNAHPVDPNFCSLIHRYFNFRHLQILPGMFRKFLFFAVRHTANTPEGLRGTVLSSHFKDLI